MTKIHRDRIIFRISDILGKMKIYKYNDDIIKLPIDKGLVALDDFCYYKSETSYSLDCLSEELASLSVVVYVYHSTINDDELCEYMINAVRKHCKFPDGLDQQIKFLLSVIDNMNKFVRRLRINETDCFFNRLMAYPLDGMFRLPWDYVEFDDGRIILYHPNHRKTNNHLPFVIEDANSRKSYNSIKRTFKKQLGYLFIKSKNGLIIDLTNKIKCSEIVTVFEHFTECPTLSYNELKKRFWNPTSHYRAFSGKIEWNSDYLEFLSDKQLEKYQIIYCNEIVKHYSAFTVSKKEHAYIFTIKEDTEKAVLVYENDNLQHCTYILFVDINYIDDAKECIVDFFGSLEDNKRQDMYLYENLLKDYGVLQIERILHSNFESWKNKIVKVIR